MALASTFAELVASCPKHAQSVLTQNGLVAFRGAFQDKPAQWREESVATLLTYQEKAAAATGGFGLGKENGFRELVNKDVGRFDLNLDHICEEQDPELFICAIRNHMEAVIAPVLVETFGEDYVLNAKGVVTSYPGTSSQNWHIDSSWLFKGLTQQPCHFVTCFMPLYTATAAIGPTEFAAGSHAHTHVLGRNKVEEQYPPPDICDAILARPDVTKLTMDCAVGDIIVMDGRLLHRGLANISDQVRPLVYLSFCPPWYREWPASQSSARALFPTPATE
jgi:ectoine hydroxylase-related dioxygenase (phytanoyl-CoA dioxygenase family)